ncbi:cell wall assembly regulator SMI1 [Streptacidiphilus sp. MAP12-33]|uniref:SMI1/KNR4 family protein n=1 Tax=Streptacidiphilus sp. MAP12-33 TaxID=3156266 RepID=UPI0035120CBA
MTETLHQAWTRFASCLVRQAPASYTALRPPASAERLAALEAALGFALHPELRGLLELHEGASRTSVGFLPLSHRLCAAVEIAEINAMFADYEQENRDAGVWEDEDAVMGHPHQWVPFAHSIDGGLAFVDHRPGPGYGMVHEFGMGLGDCETTVWASGLTELFAALADSVRSAEPFGVFRPAPGETPAGERVLSWDVRR